MACINWSKSSLSSVSRMKIYTHIAIILLFVVMLSLFLGEQSLLRHYSTMNGAESYPRPPQPSETRVIIYAKYRTGSTYTSEFLVKHDLSFYMFEPLRPGYIDALSGKSVDVPLDILEDLFQCKIINSSYLEWVRRAWFGYSTFCHPDVKQPACSGHTSFERTVNNAELVCKMSTFKVIKVIRVYHLRDLAKFMAQGVKVIHLIRDPRGIFTSRDQLYSGSNQEQQKVFLERVHNLCEAGVDDLDFIHNFVHKENYHVVRYEDLAFFPVEEGTRLYDFIDITPTRKVSDWMTDVEISNKGPWNNTLRQQRKAGSFNTERDNSAYSSQSWRENISKDTLNVIQHSCQVFMNKTAYIPLKIEAVRDYSIPALQSIRPDRMRKYTP